MTSGVPRNYGLAPDTRGRRRQMAASLLRLVLTGVLMVVVYYRAPLDRPLDDQVAVWFAVALVALGAAVLWQVRAIMVSDAPRLRATEVAGVGLPLLLLLYASVYTLMSHNQLTSFTQPLNRTDALYFALTVFATVGFGDIAPVTESARIVTMTQIVVGLLAVGVVAKVLFGAVQLATQQREPHDKDESTE